MTNVLHFYIFLRVLYRILPVLKPVLFLVIDGGQPGWTTVSFLHINNMKWWPITVLQMGK